MRTPITRVSNWLRGWPAPSASAEHYSSLLTPKIVKGVSWRVIVRPTTERSPQNALCQKKKLTKPLNSQGRSDLPVVRVLKLLFVPQRGHGLDARSSTRRSVAGQEHGTQKNAHGGSDVQRIIGLDPIKKCADELRRQKRPP